MAVFHGCGLNFAVVSLVSYFYHQSLYQDWISAAFIPFFFGAILFRVFLSTWRMNIKTPFLFFWNLLSCDFVILLLFLFQLSWQCRGRSPCNGNVKATSKFVVLLGLVDGPTCLGGFKHPRLVFELKSYFSFSCPFLLYLESMFFFSDVET